MNIIEMKSHKLYTSAQEKIEKLKKELNLHVEKNLKSLGKRVNLPEDSFMRSLLPEVFGKQSNSKKTVHKNKPIIPYESITKKELYEIAKLKKVDGRASMSKKELYNILKNEI